MMAGSKNYSRELLHYFNQPQNIWTEENDSRIMEIRCGDLTGGELIWFYVEFNESNDLIRKCWFRASGSVTTIGLASWMTTFAVNKPLNEVVTKVVHEAKIQLKLQPSGWRILHSIRKSFAELKEDMEF